MMQFSLGAVDINESGFQHTFLLPRGPVGVWMRRNAVKHVAASKSLAGKRTGQLAKSIGSNYTNYRAFQQVEIKASARHAYYHHEGTKPHTIKARGNGTLVFGSKGRVVRTKSVQHPGTSPNPYLTTPIVPIWGG